MFNPFEIQKQNQNQQPNPNIVSSINNSSISFNLNNSKKNNHKKINSQNFANIINEKMNQKINKKNGLNQEEPLVEKQNLVVNLNNLKGNYSDKHHYFIGSIINRNQTKSLQNIQRIIKNQMFQNVRWNLPFHTRYIYLGYLDSAVAHEIMNKIFNPLCLAISEKYKKFNCKYEKILYRSKPPRDRGNKIISVQFKDESDKINKVLIPYLKKEGLKKIYDVESKMEKPHIDLLYLNCQDEIYKQIASSSPKIRFPPYGFEIDHLCLIKGTPYTKKFGIPSKYDRLNIEVVRDYYYPLRGEE